MAARTIDRGNRHGFSSADEGHRALVLSALDRWAAWRRDTPWKRLGFMSKTLEARLQDEGGVLIRGDGLKMDDDDTPEIVERAVRDMNPTNADALKIRYLHGYKDRRAAGVLGCSVATYRRAIDKAIEFIAGRLTA